MTFTKVAPGVFANTDSDVKISTSHPDPCFLIQPLDEGKVFANKDSILVFSSIQNLEQFVDARHLDPQEYRVVEISWDDLVDQYSDTKIEFATIDHKGTEGFYQTVPLQKGA